MFKMYYMRRKPDVIIIGYNEVPFQDYLSTLRQYGEKSEAYRDLRMNFFDIGDQVFTYIDLLNRVSGRNFYSCDIPNLAAVYLSNYLKKRGISCDFINLFQQEKDQLSFWLKENPLCVAITTTFYVTNQPVREMVKFIRECNSKVPIIVGGVLVANYFNTYSEDEFLYVLEDMGADMYVLESQGEETLYNLVTALKENKDLFSVKNLILYDKNRNLVINERKLENNSIDDEAINWTYFQDYDFGNTLQTRTARSCAFACAFCGYPARGGPLVSAKIDTVERELETMKKLSGVQNVVFIDDTFNVPKGRFREFCQMLIGKQFNFKWFSYYRCDHGDEETIDLMRRSGCTGVFLGIESGSQFILEKMNKRAKIINYQNGIRHLKENGILTFASFITGFPGETDDTVRETLNFICENKPDYWRTMLWYCDPLTPVYKTKKDEFGIKGEGFKWKHYTMDSMQATEHIYDLFGNVSPDDSIYMPQYSFDFWIIPYLLGKGISLPKFKKFMYGAHQALLAELGETNKYLRILRRQQIFEKLKDEFAEEKIKNQEFSL
jgi:radical SAM PhpK family P-methyltransferase